MFAAVRGRWEVPFPYFHITEIFQLTYEFSTENRLIDHFSLFFGCLLSIDRLSPFGNRLEPPSTDSACINCQVCLLYVCCSTHSRFPVCFWRASEHMHPYALVSLVYMTRGVERVAYVIAWYVLTSPQFNELFRLLTSCVCVCKLRCAKSIGLRSRLG